MKHVPILLAITALTLPNLAAAGEGAPRPLVNRLPPVMLDGKPLPFSQGVKVGDMLYMSGQIGLEGDNSLPHGIDAQARRVMERIGDTLTLAGLGWKNVIRCTVMIENMADWPTFNKVYATYVDPDHLPARSAFGTDGLALGALVEVQCDAYAPVK